MQTSIASLSKAYLYFLANQQALYAQYSDAFIIIHDTQILGPYQTGLEAYREAFARYEMGTFMVRYCGEVNNEKVQ